MEFFVYIVESPSAPDLYHGRSEGSLVAQAVALDLIPCVTRTAISSAAFLAALKIGLPDAMKQYPNRLPILHVSAHGGMNGIQLSSGEQLAWLPFRLLLTPINESLRGTLLLCMSACEGYSACQMAMQDGNAAHPFLAMIGNYGKPTWSDTAVAYSAFYHILSKGRPVHEAVEAMKAASGNAQWGLETADKLKRGYLEFISAVKPIEARENLEVAAAAAEVSPAAKAFEVPVGG